MMVTALAADGSRANPHDRRLGMRAPRGQLVGFGNEGDAFDPGKGREMIGQFRLLRIHGAQRAR